MMGISRRDDLYKTVVTQLHEYYQKNSGFGSVMFSDFEDRFLSKFIPAEYYRDFTEKHKDKTLREIIVKTANDFGEVVAKKGMIDRIIDDHMNRNNIALLQDRIVDIFITQRENYYSKFVEAVAGSNAKSGVSKDLFERLKLAHEEEIKKRCQLEDDRERLVNIVKQIMPKIEDYKSQIEILESQVRELETERDGLRLQLNSRADSRAELRSDLRPVAPADTSKPTKSVKTTPKKESPPKKVEKVVEPSESSSENSENSESDDSGETAYKRQQEAIRERLRQREDDPWGL
jgi:hypothetical protein